LVKVLTYSDVLIISGWGLVSPIFAVFIAEQVTGGNIELVGLATAVYLVLKSFLQIPVARFIDKHRGEIDDLIIMAFGTLIISTIPFLFYHTRSAIQLLLIQALHGVGAAMITPGWSAIFTRHIDPHREAQEWSLYNSMVNLGAALAGALGGFLAEKFGFQTLFLVVGAVCIAGTSLLYFVYQDIRLAEKGKKIPWLG